MGAFRIFRRFAELFDRETVDLPAINTPLADALAGKADIDGTENFEVTGLLTANHIHGDIAGSLYVHVYLQEAVSKGDPVYVSGYDSGLGQPKVRRARADDALRMPAIGVMDADYDADQGGANCVISGIIEGLDLSNGFAVNEPIYVAETGGFTSTQPSSNVQQVGICDRAQQNNGSFVVTTQSVKPNQDLDTDSSVEFASLDILGNLNLGGDIGGLSTGLTFGDGDTGIWESSDDTLRLSTNSSTRIVLDSSGKVGIGTTSPTAPLEVKAPNGQNLFCLNNGSSGFLTVDSGSHWYRFKTSTSVTDLLFDIHGTVRLQSANENLEFVTGTTLKGHFLNSGEFEILGGGTDNERISFSCDSAGDATIDVQSDTGGSGSGDLSINAAQVSVPSRIISSWFHSPASGAYSLRLDSNVTLANGATGRSLNLQGDEIRFSNNTREPAIGWAQTKNVNNSNLNTAFFKISDGVVGIGHSTGLNSYDKNSGSLNLSKINLKPISTAPASPSAGDLYFDSTTNKLRCYDGTAWNNCF